MQEELGERKKKKKKKEEPPQNQPPSIFLFSFTWTHPETVMVMSYFLFFSIKAQCREHFRWYLDICHQLYSL